MDSSILTPAEIQTVVSIYIDFLADHYYDIKWKKQNMPTINHPNVNFILGPRKYSAVIETIEPKFAGGNIFTSTTIGNIVHANEHVDFSRPKNETQDAFFVRIDYEIVGVLKDNKISFLDKPAKLSEYLVLTTDKSDGKYKIIDKYPVLDENYFVGCNSVFANINSYNFDKTTIEKLDHFVTNRKE
jgi:hypothetical protein